MQSDIRASGAHRFGRALRFKARISKSLDTKGKQQLRCCSRITMADEIALNRAAERGARAQRLLEDDLLAEAFATLDAEYTKAWRTTAARDTDARERLWQAVQIVAKVRDHLASVASGGKLARRELDDLAARRKYFGIV